MGESALRKRAALRELHEDWNVPLEQLSKVSSISLKTLTSNALREGWRPRRSAISIQGRFIEIFEQELQRFATIRDEDCNEEKRARALSTLAKALEAIAIVEGRVWNNSTAQTTETQKDRNSKPDETLSKIDPNRTADLDRQLAELVQNLT
ncbi:MAG: hypothetical protein V3V04_07120 [Rhizobiaceae bacterium]